MGGEEVPSSRGMGRMEQTPVAISICSTEPESWDTIWKWSWFCRDFWWEGYRREAETAVADLFAFLRTRSVRSVLDCACGLGMKTILFAEQGYEVEGADASAVAAEYAPKLAAEKGLGIRFIHARNEELGQKCGRTYDCVFSDGFDELATHEALVCSARGIYAVLNDGGILVFSGIAPEWSESDLQAVIDKEWQEREPFVVLAPFERDGVRLTELEVDERTPEGILEKRIFLIEEEGALRAEIALLMNRRKWAFRDLDKVLTAAGFRSVSTEKTGTTLFTVAVR